MKIISSLSLLIALFALPAFAKITLYSNSDAVAHLVGSAQFRDLEQKMGSISALTVVERYDSNAIQAFEFKVTLTPKGSAQAKSCFVNADVFVERDSSAPAGIVASRMTDPVLLTPVCP